MGRAIVTLDTSALFALLNRRDPDHQPITQALLADRGAYLVPAGILTEIGYFVEQRLGLDVLDAFLADLQERAFVLETSDDDLTRIRKLARRYTDLPLGLADASVIAYAERHDGRVLTFEYRHFGTVAREGTTTLLPT